MRITIDYYTKAEKYCHTNISPRLYWMQNQIGGTGWRLIRSQQSPRWVLEIDDNIEAERHFTWMTLANQL